MNIRVFLAAGVLLHAGSSLADLIDDSSASLALRNYYYDRDFRSGPGQSQAQEWAQGFTFRLDSGFTEGPVGFGVNLLGMTGVKLDSSPDRTGTGLLPFDPATREPADEYSKLGAAAKLRIWASELHVGTLQPLLPVILAVPSRLFPPTFRGAYLRSNEIEGLTLHAGHMDRITQRNSTNQEPMRISSPNRRFDAGAESDSFSFAGADYRFNDNLNGSYYYAQLDDLYQQHYLGLVHYLPLGDGKLKSDLRFFDSREDGAAKAGPVDNRTYNAMFTYQLKAHSLGLGYMQLSGDTALPYLAGTDVNVNTEGALVSEFVNPGERVWQVRYDYDFAALGIPGLRGMWRYIKGDDIDLPGANASAKERERDIELAYVVQSGDLKGLGIRVRQGAYRNDFSRDVDETRITLDYTIKLW
ncbi:OprD family porin [Pseudomonas boanensis]|uniref:OprD family porin n=1 Tax=Metapseudomonas boanensis TaxID=2822138 RepID=UPI0035D470EF